MGVAVGHDGIDTGCDKYWNIPTASSDTAEEANSPTLTPPS